MSSKEKIEYLAKNYYNKMHAEAEKILGDPSLAEDACQDTFIKLMNIVDSISNVESVMTRNFCIIVLKNTARDIARKWYRQIPFDFGDEDDRALRSWDSYPFETEDMIQEIYELPDYYRTVVAMRCLAGKSCLETAELTGTTVGVVNCRLNRARKILQKKWNIVA